MLRIIGGVDKGRKLVGPKGREFRPATARVKTFVFSILHSDVVDARCLDLFSGTGSIGIEALSRGAANVLFVEKAGSSRKLLERNLEICGYTNRSDIIRSDVFTTIRRLGESRKKFLFIFADPPFKENFRSRIVKAVSQADILAEKGLLMVEHESHDNDPMDHGLKLHRQKVFGGSTVSIYEH